MSSDRLWKKDFILVTLTNFLVYMIFYILMAIIAPYCVQNLRTSTGIAGLISGIFLIGILTGRLGIGRIVQEVGSKKILLVGTFLHILSSLFYLFASNVMFLLGTRFFHGIAFGIAHTGASTIAAQVIPKGRQGEGIGFYTQSQIIATAVGPFLGILLSRNLGFKAVFLTGLFIALMGFLVSLFITEPSSEGLKRVQSKRGLRLSQLIEYRAVPISLIILISGFIYFSLMTFLPLYGKKANLEGPVSLFFLVYAITVILSRPISGRLLDLKGPDFVVYPCLLLFGGGMTLLGCAKSGFLLLLSAVIIGLGYGNFFSCGHAIAIKSVPPEKIGLATATYYIFIDIGSGVGPYIFGSLLPFMDYKGLFFLLSLVVFSTLLLYRFFVSRFLRSIN